jgi:hypothetical protein
VKHSTGKVRIIPIEDETIIDFTTDNFTGSLVAELDETTLKVQKYWDVSHSKHIKP